MNEQQKQACIDYINSHAPELHGILAERLDIGPPVTVDNIVSVNIRGDNVIAIIDRGIKGSPKYTLPVSVLQSFVEQRPGEVAQAQAENATRAEVKLHRGRK